jgi:hypothetical protein
MFEPPRGPTPNDQQRIYFALAEATTEEAIASTLFEIRLLAASDLDRVVGLEEISPELGQEILAAVEAWASLASAVVMEFSLTQQRRNIGAAWKLGGRVWPGWKKALAGQLRQVGDTLRPSLSAARTALGATSFSISVGFPWGISVGLSWAAPRWVLASADGTEQIVLEAVS